MRFNRRRSRWRWQRSDSGFVLPLVIGLGLMLILIGLTLFLRSQNAQISASARQDSAQGLSAAEAGVTLAQAFVDRRRFLADDDSGTATSTTGWVNDLQTRADAYQTYVGVACPEIADTNPATADAKATAINYLGGTTTSTLFPLANNAGKFRIVKYDSPANSKLKQAAASTTNVLSVRSTTGFLVGDALQVGLDPVSNTITSIDAANNTLTLTAPLGSDQEIHAPVIELKNAVLTIEGAPEQSNPVVSSLARVRVEIPLDTNSPVPPPALWASNFNLVTDNVVVGNIRAYACPSGTGSIGSAGTNIVSDANLVTNSGELKIDPYQRIPSAFIAPTAGTGIYPLTSALSGSITLPRATDLPDARGDYHYTFSGAAGNQIAASTIITINGAQIAPGKGINIYPDDNLDLSGVTTIVSGVTLGDQQRYLRILGQNTTNTIQINGATSLGNANLIVLVHGPMATATLSNPDAGGTGIIGSLWVKSVAATTSPASQKTWITGCSSCSWGGMAPTILFTEILSPVRLSSASAWAVCSRDMDTSGMPTNSWERANTNTAGSAADLACNGT